MKVAVSCDKEDIEGLAFERRTIAARYGYASNRWSSSDEYVVEFTSLGAFLDWAMAFWAIEVEEARLEDGTPIPIVITKDEPDIRDCD